MMLSMTPPVAQSTQVAQAPPAAPEPAPSGCRLVAVEPWSLDAFGEPMVRCRRVCTGTPVEEKPTDQLWVTPGPEVARDRRRST